jgi:hypothetical protein
LVAGALALAGGVAGLLGANGTFSGTLTASSARPAATGPSGRQAVAEQDDGASALSGKAPATGPRASAEAKAREVQQDVAPKSTATSSAVTSGSAPTGAAPTGAAPTGAASPGVVEPGMVAGTTAPEDMLAGGPEAGDEAGYKADGPSRHTDRQAAEYFRTHWGPDDKALKRLKDIRTVGGYLRIYTDLPETAHNSTAAITLCKRGLEYLRAAGVANPVVFVQAQFGDNGNPVLANILGPSDHSCRVTHPAPN